MDKEKFISVLIIDDSEDDRIIARRILEKKNFKILEAGEWMDGMELIGKGGIDLVLLDMIMPDMDGMELLEIIRKEKSKLNLPVIIYSCYDVDYSDDKKYANGYIKKYGEPETLISKISEVLAINKAIDRSKPPVFVAR